MPNLAKGFQFSGLPCKIKLYIAKKRFDVSILAQIVPFPRVLLEGNCHEKKLAVHVNNL